MKESGLINAPVSSRNLSGRNFSGSSHVFSSHMTASKLGSTTASAGIVFLPAPSPLLWRSSPKFGSTSWSSPPRREYRGRNATPVWNRAERPQNPRESRGKRRDYSLRQDRPPFKSPQKRREVTQPGRSRETEPDQPQLKDLLRSMMAGLESRLGRMMDDKLSNFASRIEEKVSSLSLRVEKMEDRIDKLEKSRRSPSPKTRSTSPLTCYGCGSSGQFYLTVPRARRQVRQI
ncbi:hypothetical protein PoB_001807600 [Plakobranchus ocellatus]|uniref:Uncharacterized protein n=1 Tax=Plakobranchus ocellatus TaxID=259542 RepID=A0AAV3ZA92_9GAST|nr:hypothetical protein PoB_001807600 [Plakobranchus ocellatus]